MGKISLVLEFSLLVALPFGSVLSQEDSYKNLIGLGSFFPNTEGAAALSDDDGEEGSSLADFVDEFLVSDGGRYRWGTCRVKRTGGSSSIKNVQRCRYLAAMYKISRQECHQALY